MRRMYVAIVEPETGELPVFWAYGKTPEEALDNLQRDTNESSMVFHVKAVRNRMHYHPDDWVLFGRTYAPDGYDAVVLSGSKYLRNWTS